MARGGGAGPADVWSGFTSDPRSPAAADLRASDGDRDLVLDVLAAAFADGRLGRSEYDERCDAALALRRLGEVSPLVSDLAALPAVRGSWQDLREEASGRFRREVRDARNGFVVVSLTTLGVWGGTALFLGPYFFWPVFPILALGIGWAATAAGQQSRLDDLEQEILERRRHRRDGP
ncbi:DUF1707 domain-containing protein [Aeromicrobium sp. CF4.19]|uniref:DUF1707 SHOCT-like domain-containing protein n=1 Tax=Aeromicrobium sp. CF4.19 TaxID=3373082 RepID=UPI003EE57D95